MSIRCIQCMNYMFFLRMSNRKCPNNKYLYQTAGTISLHLTRVSCLHLLRREDHEFPTTLSFI